jgi:peptidoglycan/LPS O-acetylase OafA/YrhL
MHRGPRFQQPDVGHLCLPNAKLGVVVAISYGFPMQSNNRKNIKSLMYLRFIALLLVIYQHLSSNIHSQYHLETDFIGLNSGQFGVALFCGLSGYLSSHRFSSISNWIKKRFWKIYPTYWLVIFLCVFGNYILKYKEITLYSVFLQFLGLSYLVPSESLLNVSTWFITLIIFNYFIVIVLNFFSNKKLVILAIYIYIGFFIILLMNDFHVGFFRQSLTFISCYYLSVMNKYKINFHKFLLLMFVYLTLSTFGFETWYPFVSISVLVIFLKLNISNNYMVKFISDISYEIFLFHGPFIVLFLKFYRENLILSLFLIFVFTINTSYFTQVILEKLKKRCLNFKDVFAAN